MSQMDPFYFEVFLLRGVQPLILDARYPRNTSAGKTRAVPPAPPPLGISTRTGYHTHYPPPISTLEGEDGVSYHGPSDSSLSAADSTADATDEKTSEPGQLHMLKRRYHDIEARLKTIKSQIRSGLASGYVCGAIRAIFLGIACLCACFYLSLDSLWTCKSEGRISPLAQAFVP